MLSIEGGNAFSAAKSIFQQVVVKKTMPRGSSLSDDEVDLLKEWIEAGSPDDHGNARLTSDQSKEVIGSQGAKK